MQCMEVCPIRKEAEMLSDREARSECCRGRIMKQKG
jgi:hypothetical protein